MMSISKSALVARAADAAKIYYPLHTVRCVGPAKFRNQLARDVACLLDVDDNVESWSSVSVQVKCSLEAHQPDFSVRTPVGALLIDVCTEEVRPPFWVQEAAADAGYRYETRDQTDIPPIRLKNARDLLRYARFETSLSDRVRLLTALSEHGNLSVSECMPAFVDVSPIAGLASLILQRVVEVDLDDCLIGPDTIVRHRRY